MMRPILRRLLTARILPIAAAVFALLSLNYLLDSALSDALFAAPTIPSDLSGVWDDHPVVHLHRSAVSDFEAFLARQSKTVDEAEREYVRRYRRPPPAGFRRWIQYALANRSPVIDDFDIIAEGVHPFLNYSPSEIGQRIQNALQTKAGDHIELCKFSGGKFGPGCRSWAGPLLELLGGSRRLAPDVELLMNFLDEPSVLPAAKGTQRTDSAAPPASSLWTDMSHRSIAAAVAEACGTRGGIQLPASSEVAGGSFGIRFVTNATAERDLCEHPEYASQHGFVMCPPSLKRLSTEVPVLSRAAPYPFSDIIYPAIHYSLKSSLYSSWTDRSWRAKKNAVYWAGSSTGGEWSPETWRKGHRQRLVALAKGKEGNKFTVLQDSGGPAGALPRTGAAVDTTLFDVGFTRIVGCASTSVCDEQISFFDPSRRPDPESRPLKYRFALDIDGNSFSGRFYRLLASRSVPLKVTVFREWHDDRLWPWLHYIPVSLGMEELPELVRFLTSTAAGQRVAQQIADAGRQWYGKAITPTHQGIYLYRLMLEMARLQDESRVPG